MQKIGLDIGTKNIVMAYEKDGAVKFRREVNGFLNIPKVDNFTKQMLDKSGVPYITKEDGGIVALGEKAEELAYSFGHVLQRPMENGVLSIKEKEAMRIMGVIIKSIIGKINDDLLIYYCIPAAPLDATANVAYHEKIIDVIFESFEGDVESHSINEARALIVSGIEDQTGIGISCGAGMINVSYCLFGIPIYQFSLVGAGDWVDKKAAEVTGENPTAITKVKEKMSLDTTPPEKNIERAVWIHYRLLIENIARGIMEGFKKNESKAKAPKPMPIIIAGGTSSPDGFVKLFKSVFNEQSMPFEIGEITKADLPLYAVAHGCLIAAQHHASE